MGGVPYSSKGCLTCRRRKIKCGLQIPDCVQCMKRGVSCGGYNTNRIFISYDQSSMQLQNVGRSRSATPKNIDDINTIPEIREQLFATFIGAYFPVNTEGDSQVDSWRYLISGFQVLPQKTMMLQRALSAICCVFIGRINDDERLSHHGIQLYNYSMRSMSKMLCVKSHSEEALYATVIFQMIEKCIALKKTTEPNSAHDCANGFDPWVFHMQAMSSLLKENQHKSSTNPLIHAISTSHAKLAIIYGILAIRWTGEENTHFISSSPQTPLDEIFEMFLNGRTLFHAVDIMSTLPLGDPEASPKACFALLQRVAEYRDQLTSWYNDKEASIGAPSVCEKRDGKLFNKAFLENSPFQENFYQFSSLDSARIHILYWTAMSFAHTLVYRAQMMATSINWTAFPNNQFFVDPSNYESFVLAGNHVDRVCRSIPYCMQPMHRIWGTHVVFGVMGNVFRTYIQQLNRDKFLWCQRVLETAGGLGLGMAFYFSGVADREWAALEDATSSISSSPSRTRTPSYAESPDTQYSDEALCSQKLSDCELLLPVSSPGEFPVSF